MNGIRDEFGIKTSLLSRKHLTAFSGRFLYEPAALRRPVAQEYKKVSKRNRVQ